jgi:hypothetical protein
MTGPSLEANARTTRHTTLGPFASRLSARHTYPSACVVPATDRYFGLLHGDYRLSKIRITNK